jgi:hypothetical protein
MYLIQLNNGKFKQADGYDPPYPPLSGISKFSNILRGE